MIKGKTPEEIRKLFNIQNDFSPEEEAQIRKENVSVNSIPQSLGAAARACLKILTMRRFLFLLRLAHLQQEWAEDR